MDIDINELFTIVNNSQLNKEIVDENFKNINQNTLL